GVSIDPAREVGVVVCFLPPDDAEAPRRLVERAVEAERATVAFWRSVPVDPSVLSARALASLPIIQQAVVVAPPGVAGDDFERLLFLARKRIERDASSAEFPIRSASARTAVYKGRSTAADIAAFYWDLADPDHATASPCCHRRYATGTLPSGHVAQRLRAVARDGEINPVASDRPCAQAGESAAMVPGRGPTVWGARIGDLRPSLQPGLWDSGS